jgi:hypothetical protein
MSKKKRTTGDEIMLPPGRCSFVHVFDTVKRRDGTEIHELTLLIPKKEGIDDTVDRLNKAIGTTPSIQPLIAALKKLKAECGYEEKEVLKAPFKDGSKPNGKGNVYEGYENHWAIRAWTKNPPGVRDAENTSDIIDPSKLYPGCYARMVVSPFIYEGDMNNGFSLFLNHVQFLADGEKLGGSGSGSAEGAFTAVSKVSDDAENFKSDSALFEVEDGFEI